MALVLELFFHQLQSDCADATAESLFYLKEAGNRERMIWKCLFSQHQMAINQL